MKAVIFAGGLGARLAPFTKIIPKPLLPVGDRSVMEIQINQLKKYGVDEFYFAVFYKADMLESYFGNGKKMGVKINYNREKKKLGTCGPLSLLRDDIHEDFIVMNGDILTNLNFRNAFDFHLSKKSVMTVVSKEVVFPVSYGSLVCKKDKILGIEEKPDITLDISTGIYIMNPAVFDLIPYNKKFNMDELILKLISEKIPIYRYAMSEYWLDIGRMEDYQKAQKDYKKHFK